MIERKNIITRSLIPERFNDLLTSLALAHIATIGPKGEPQSTPIWFDWDGQYIRFSLTKGRQKYHNVQREPRVALSVVDTTNQFRNLEIRGKVVSIEDDLDRTFINKMSKKYTNQDVYTADQPDVRRIIITVNPERVNKLELTREQRPLPQE